MKEFTTKIITKPFFLLKNVIVIYNQSHDLLKIAKEVFMFLLYIFIIAFYYIYMSTYKFSDDNCELISLCTINFEESKPFVNTQPNIWYKHIIDDFFNKFTSNSKIVNYKVIEIKSDCVVKTLWFECNLETEKKPVILNKIQSDYMKSIISECEFYKNKASLLETQLLKAKISYQYLIKDINDIVKEINDSFKKS
jgi:hypothetical protein